MQVGYNVQLTQDEINDALALRVIQAFKAKNPGVVLDETALMRGGIKVFLLDKDQKPVEVASAMVTWAT